MYRMKRMLMLLVTGLVLSLSTFTAGASAQTGGSFYEPFNNYNTGLWQKPMDTRMETCLTVRGVQITCR